MIRSSGSLRTLLLVLTAGVTSVLLGFGAVSVASALGAPGERDLGGPVVFDPAMLTAPTPTPGSAGALADQPVGGGQGAADAPARAPAPAPAPAPARAPAPAPAPAPARAPATAPAPTHHPEQVVPAPPSPADGDHPGGG